MPAMQSELVEFRLLQVLGSIVGDERRTVALVHWDGHQMRFAWNRLDIPQPQAANDIRRIIGTLRTEVESIGTQQMHLGLECLETLVPAPSGHSGILTWSPVHSGATVNPGAHFAELCTELRLSLPATLSKQRTGVTQHLLALGERIRSELSYTVREAVRIRESVTGISRYESPLSWKNGQWHHSVPVNLSRVSVDKFGAKYQRALGVVGAAIPPKHVGVIVAFHGDATGASARLSEMEGYIRAKFAGRVDCERVVMDAGNPVFARFENRIKKDVDASA